MGCCKLGERGGGVWDFLFVCLVLFFVTLHSLSLQTPEAQIDYSGELKEGWGRGKKDLVAIIESAALLGPGCAGVSDSRWPSVGRAVLCDLRGRKLLAQHENIYLVCLIAVTHLRALALAPTHVKTLVCVHASTCAHTHTHSHSRILIFVHVLIHRHFKRLCAGA